MKNNQFRKTKWNTPRAALFMATLGTASAPLLTSTPAQAQYQAPIGVVINGTRVNVGSVSPINEGGRVLVPLRGVLEALGATVGFNNSTSTVTAQRGTTDIQLRLGSRQAYVDGQLRTLDVPARTIDGRTVVPLRFMSEALGAQVQWNASQNAVYITSSGSGSSLVVTNPPNNYQTIYGRVTNNLTGARRFQVRTDNGAVITVRTVVGNEPARLSVGDRVQLVGNYAGNVFDAQSATIIADTVRRTTLTGRVVTVLNNRRFTLRANNRLYTVNVPSGLTSSIRSGAQVSVTGNLNGTILQRATFNNTISDFLPSEGESVNWTGTVSNLNITGNTFQLRSSNNRVYTVRYRSPEALRVGDRVRVVGVYRNGAVDSSSVTRVSNVVID